MERAGEVSLRVYVYVGDSWDILERFISRPVDRDGMVQVMGIKLYADGALGSRSAALIDPYDDDARSTGLLFQETAELRRRVRASHEAGYQLAVHTIGDAANGQALEVLGELPADARPRIEHAQVVHRDDLSLFADRGVVASVQPIHATSDMGWSRPIPGSAFTRRSHARVEATVPPGGFLPEQKLPTAEAVARFTRYPAAARRDDGGRLVPGARRILSFWIATLSKRHRSSSAEVDSGIPNRF